MAEPMRQFDHFYDRLLCTIRVTQCPEPISGPEERVALQVHVYRMDEMAMPLGIVGCHHLICGLTGPSEVAHKALGMCLQGSRNHQDLPILMGLGQGVELLADFQASGIFATHIVVIPDIPKDG